MEYLHELLKDLDAYPSESVPFYLLSKIFKAFRKSKVRRPEIYAIHGPAYCNSLSTEEKFVFYEQIYIGALDYGNVGLAKNYLDILVAQFPNSSRVKRLEGMLAESNGEYDIALETYDALLKENSANILVLKRKVAALRSQGKYKLAIEALHEILKVFQSDATSWLELADIHLSLCDYQSAAYCYEEVVLLMPTSAPTYCRLAETLYSLGGGENLVKARQYYSISLTHQKSLNNIRALYGLLATCREIMCLPNKRVPEGEGEVTEAMHTWCLEQLNTNKSKDGTSEISTIIASGLS